MTARRLFLAALTTLGVAAAAPAVAAAADELVWQTPVTASGAATNVVGPTVLASPDGSVTVLWQEVTGGESQLASRSRSAQGVWGDPELVSATPGGIADGGLVTTAGDSSVTAAWMSSDYATQYFAVKQPGSLTFTEQTVQAPDAGEYFWGGALAAGPNDSTVLLTSGGVGSDHKLRVRERAAGSSTFTVTSEIDQPDDEGQGNPAIAYNADGDAVAAWRADAGSDREIRAARFDHQSNSWSAQSVVTDDANSGDIRLAVNDQGAAAMLWLNQSQTVMNGYSMDPATGDWSSATSLLEHGPNVVLPNLAADNDGQFVAAWQEMNLVTQGDVKLLTKTYSVAGEAWSAADEISFNGFSGAPMLTVNADGDMALSLATTEDGSTLRSAITTRESGSAAFGAVALTSAEKLDVGQYGIPVGAIDDDGNVSVVYRMADGPDFKVGFVAGDGAGPSIGDTHVPTSGTVGVPVTFSTTSPFDLWSAVSVTSWAFGDGQTASGTHVTHTYTAPGRYAVSFSATDSSDFDTQSSASYITIAAPPAPPAPPVDDPIDDDEDAPPPPPKKIAAPLIEARLSGRTITLNARVTLRNGKRCSGKVTATTKFGRTTYRATLKLKASGKTCLATGKIKLKKTPSVRTKLRIKISNKNLRTRTLTTKRA